MVPAERLKEEAEPSIASWFVRATIVFSVGGRQHTAHTADDHRGIPKGQHIQRQRPTRPRLEERPKMAQTTSGRGRHSRGQERLGVNPDRPKKSWDKGNDSDVIRGRFGSPCDGKLINIFTNTFYTDTFIFIFPSLMWLRLRFDVGLCLFPQVFRIELFLLNMLLRAKQRCSRFAVIKVQKTKAAQGRI